VPAEGVGTVDEPGPPDTSQVAGDAANNNREPSLTQNNPQAVEAASARGRPSNLGVSTAAFATILAVALVVFLVCISMTLLAYKRKRQIGTPDMSLANQQALSGHFSDLTYASIWHEFQQGLTTASGGARSLPMILTSSAVGEPAAAFDASGRSVPVFKPQILLGDGTVKQIPKGIPSEWDSEAAEFQKARHRKLSCADSNLSRPSSTFDELTLHPSECTEHPKSLSISSEKEVDNKDLINAMQQSLQESSSVNICGEKNTFHPNFLTQEPMITMEGPQQGSAMFDDDSVSSSVRSGQMNWSHAGNKWRRVESQTRVLNPPESLGYPWTFLEGKGGTKPNFQLKKRNNAEGWPRDGQYTHQYEDSQEDPASQSSDKINAPVMVSSPWTSLTKAVKEDLLSSQPHASQVNLSPPSSIAEAKVLGTDNALYRTQFSDSGEDASVNPMIGKVPLGHKNMANAVAESEENRLPFQPMGMPLECGQGMRDFRNDDAGDRVAFPRYLTIQSREVELSDWEIEMHNGLQSHPWQLKDASKDKSRDPGDFGVQELDHGVEFPSHPVQWGGGSGAVGEKLKAADRGRHGDERKHSSCVKKGISQTLQTYDGQLNHGSGEAAHPQSTSGSLDEPDDRVDSEGHSVRLIHFAQAD